VKLSELDKTKLPVKVVANNSSNKIYTLKFLDADHAVLSDENGSVNFFSPNVDHWSLYEEPKPKYALYAYKLKSMSYWIPSGIFFKDDAEAVEVFGEHCQLKRLMYSEVEL